MLQHLLWILIKCQALPSIEIIYFILYWNFSLGCCWSPRLMPHVISPSMVFSLSQLQYVWIHKHDNQVGILNSKFYWVHSNSAFTTWWMRSSVADLTSLWSWRSRSDRTIVCQPCPDPTLSLKQRRSSLEPVLLVVLILLQVNIATSTHNIRCWKTGTW